MLLTNSGSTNDYKGSIFGTANWITIKLDLAGVNIVDNKTFSSLKFRKVLLMLYMLMIFNLKNL